MHTPVRIALLSLILGIAASLPARATDAESPVGVWKTFDDKTGNARGIIRIYEQSGKLFGRLEQSFVPGAESR